MALTDTTEYWWDVKSHRIYKGPNYYHHPTYQCSHINPITGNVARTPYIDDINCSECKKYIKENGIEGLKEGKASPDFYMTKSASKKYRKLIKAQQKFEELHGKCSCGNQWVIRVNSITKQKFLGCSDYPNCKRTKILNQ